MIDEKIRNFDLKHYLSEKRRRIDERLGSFLDCSFPESRLGEAMRYSLMGSGKRLRPILCLAAAEAVGGGENDTVWRAACAIEMIHTYSLVHDDLTAMDDDELRRGKPTCHVRFDEATAILAGDALLTLAFEVLSSGLPAGAADDVCRRIDVIKMIAMAAGCRGMIEGQMRDMAAEGKKIDLNALMALHALKTGALIQTAVACGALLGGGTQAQCGALETYASHIGLAFQVTDDILNVEGDPGQMGKAVGTDVIRQKSTYPVLLGLEASRQYAAILVNKALQALEIFDNKARPLTAIAEYVIERKR